MNEEVEALRAKLGIRKDYLQKFLSKMDTTLSLAEVLIKIEEKYGKSTEQDGNEENDESESESADSADVQPITEVEPAISDDVENTTDEIPAGGSSENRDPEVFSKSLRIDRDVKPYSGCYCPITGEPV